MKSIRACTVLLSLIGGTMVAQQGLAQGGLSNVLGCLAAILIFATISAVALIGGSK